MREMEAEWKTCQPPVTQGSLKPCFLVGSLVGVLVYAPRPPNDVSRGGGGGNQERARAAGGGGDTRLRSGRSGSGSLWRWPHPALVVTGRDGPPPALVVEDGRDGPLAVAGEMKEDPSLSSSSCVTKDGRGV